jgi:hypothetical protein
VCEKQCVLCDEELRWFLYIYIYIYVINMIYVYISMRVCVYQCYYDYFVGYRCVDMKCICSILIATNMSVGYRRVGMKHICCMFITTDGSVA